MTRTIQDDKDFLWELAHIFTFGENVDSLFWHTVPTFKAFIMCSDEFYWGTADAEEVLPEDLDELRKAQADVAAVEPVHKWLWTTLWVARKRGMRPQGAMYKHFTPEVVELINQAGPAREIDFGNPRDESDTYQYKVPRHD